MSFDYGTEVPDQISEFKNPELGEHTARLRSLIHLGMFKETFKGKVKKPAPYVVAIFELKDEEDFEDDGTTPLTLHKAFPLKKGDRAFMGKFIKCFDPKGVATGFDDFIGMACQVTVAPSKKKDEEGNHLYVHFGGISGMLPKFAKMIEPLEVEGAGHLPFDKLTKAAVLELNPVLEVANILMKGENYKGSRAEKIINSIRKDDPDFAVYEKENNKESKAKESSDAPAEVETDLNEEEDF